MDLTLDVALVKEFSSRFCDYGSTGVESMPFEGFIEEMRPHFLPPASVCARITSH